MVKSRRYKYLFSNIVVFVIVYNKFTVLGILFIELVGGVRESQCRSQGGLIVDRDSMRDAGSAGVRYEFSGVPVILHFPFRTIGFNLLVLRAKSAETKEGENSFVFCRDINVVRKILEIGCALCQVEPHFI